MNHPIKTPITLSIAGSDSGGGAGIQADIKAISATGGYACTVITALTAQNTKGVQAILPIPADFVAKQLDSVFNDLDIRAVKIGMLTDIDIINVVADKLEQYQPEWVVLDPVMVATSGDILLKDSAITCLKQRLLPLANLITPNLFEAALLYQKPLPKSSLDCKPLIQTIQQTSQQVLLKGGHLSKEATSHDWLITPDTIQVFSSTRINTKNTHGTGCSLSASIASYLAQEHSLINAIQLAKTYLTNALEHADQLNIGAGAGPVHHFYQQHH